ncbi:MAG: vitamin K epoxide reductase family protein [Gaiellaceae bacterium]
MNAGGARLVLAVGAAAGLAIATYLTVVHYQGGVPVCASDGCEVVQRSRYAELFGVPVALLGALAFATLLASALLQSPVVLAGAAALALASVVFAFYLVYVQAVVLDAICTWCIVSDALSAIVAVAAWLRLRHILA